ncbi:hypothetical protein [Nocardia xishanensis]
MPDIREALARIITEHEHVDASCRACPGVPFFYREEHSDHVAELIERELSGVIEWRSSAEPGVWMVAQSIPNEGITQAVPYATEVEALRVVNRSGYGEDVHAYFVPFGKEIREVMHR